MNILVADDDRMSREMLRRIIESDASYHVSLAEDGEEAWKMLGEEGKRYDVCMFDINMPKTDGFGVVARMRAAPSLKNIPVILCTAAADRSTVTKASALAVSHYIVKPYTKNVILAKLQTVSAEIARSGREDFSQILQRLGLDAETYRALVKTLLDETAKWSQGTRLAPDLGKFGKLAQRASGLRRASDIVGLNALVARFGEFDATVKSDSAASKGEHSPFLLAQIAPVLDLLDQETKRIAQKLAEFV